MDFVETSGTAFREEEFGESRKECSAASFAPMMRDRRSRKSSRRRVKAFCTSQAKSRVQIKTQRLRFQERGVSSHNEPHERFVYTTMARAQ